MVKAFTHTVAVRVPLNYTIIGGYFLFVSRLFGKRQCKGETRPLIFNFPPTFSLLLFDILFRPATDRALEDVWGLWLDALHSFIHSVETSFGVDHETVTAGPVGGQV